MARDFTDDDRDKDVYSPEGNRIGRIRDVNKDRATVERGEDDEDLTDKVKEMLGWGDDDDKHEIHRDHVDTNDDKGVRLRDQR